MILFYRNNDKVLRIIAIHVAGSSALGTRAPTIVFARRNRSAWRTDGARNQTRLSLNDWRTCRETRNEKEAKPLKTNNP